MQEAVHVGSRESDPLKHFPLNSDFNNDQVVISREKNEGKLF